MTKIMSQPDYEYISNGRFERYYSGSEIWETGRIDIKYTNDAEPEPYIVYITEKQYNETS